jgi:uncharacterized protein YbjT (DUF2867 family)
MKHAVTGAFTYSGKYIACRLLERGEQVITLTGHPGRPDPFEGRVQAFPLDFSIPAELVASLSDVHTLYNTYWVRFDHGRSTQSQAVKNTGLLIDAARKAGVKRIVHISITNPSRESPLPYFSGKAANEQFVINSGLSYAILRPTVLFGKEDILVNNIAYLLRRFPFFAIPGDGSYLIQPVFVDDLAKLAVQAGYANEQIIWDAVGPEKYTFEQLVKLIAKTLGVDRMLMHTPPKLALGASQFLSLLLRDVVLTPEEVDGLMAGLLVSNEPARCKTSIADWLEERKSSIGTVYASELARHY